MIAAWLKAHKGQTLLSVVVASATVLAGVGLLSSSAYLISWAALRPPILDLMLVIVAVRFFALSRATCRYVERMLSHDLTFRWLATLRVQLYRLLEPRLPRLLLRTRSGDLLGRMVSDVDVLQHMYLRVFVPIGTAVIVATVTVFALSTFSLSLALVTLLGLLLNGVVVPIGIARHARQWGDESVQARSQASADLVEQLQGMQDALIFGQADRSRARVHAQSRVMAGLETRHAKRTAWQDGLSHLCAFGTMWIILWLAIPLITSGALGGIWLALLSLGVLSSFEAVQPLGTLWTFRQQSQAAQQRTQEIEATPVQTERMISEEPVDEVLTAEAYSIRFASVDFAYEKRLVLRDIRFTWTAGYRLALVGPSGAGKSSIAHLVLGSERPIAGQIIVNQRDLAAWHPSIWMQQIAVVPQHTHLFNNTVRENLRLARQGVSDDECWAVLEQVELANTIRALPHGLDTWIGEQGARLSGGERQRLAIARAVLKQAPIWVLDEPTSHLDQSTEQALVQLLLDVTKGKSTLWISHRLIGLDCLDSILVIQQGGICERGSHEKLIAANGYYARMLRQEHQLLNDNDSGPG